MIEDRKVSGGPFFEKFIPLMGISYDIIPMLRQVISRVCTREDSAIAKNAVSITRIVAERKRERERERERAWKGVVDLLVKEQVDRLNVVDATWPRHW